MKDGTMFWGLLFLCVGLLLLVQTILKIDLPILRILLGVGIAYIGVKMVFGSFELNMNGLRLEKVATANKMVFSEGDFSAKGDGSSGLNREFATVFGDSKLDLSSLSGDDLKSGFEVSTVFGKTEITTSRDIPLVVSTNSAFGRVNVRGDKSTAIGNGEYRSPGFSKDKPHLRIEANSVFGSIEIN